jgi:hypothetical protein
MYRHNRYRWSRDCRLSPDHAGKRVRRKRRARIVKVDTLRRQPRQCRLGMSLHIPCEIRLVHSVHRYEQDVLNFCRRAVVAIPIVTGILRPCRHGHQAGNQRAKATKELRGGRIRKNWVCFHRHITSYILLLFLSPN